MSGTGPGELERTDRTTKEKRYYITSLTLDAECIVEDIRTHWSVKNDLH
ncbi:hypothetical protein [Hoylesella pleuritidis]|nr:hypothetical protein [Hoylesella pleuritidis]